MASVLVHFTLQGLGMRLPISRILGASVLFNSTTTTTKTQAGFRSRGHQLHPWQEALLTKWLSLGCAGRPGLEPALPDCSG